MYSQLPSHSIVPMNFGYHSVNDYRPHPQLVQHWGNEHWTNYPPSIYAASTAKMRMPPQVPLQMPVQMPVQSKAESNGLIVEQASVAASDHETVPTPNVTVAEPCRTASNIENYVLTALIRMFPAHPFVKMRPTWLRNPRTNRKCELDFYNEELKLAIEVQGQQHYVFPNSLHKTRGEWEDQVYRDRLKEDLCRYTGVTLVHVPFTVSQKDIESYIWQEIERVGIPGAALLSFIARKI